MTTNLLDTVRLEIDASDAANRITNHSASSDTTGWTAVSGTTLSRVLGNYGQIGTAFRTAPQFVGGSAGYVGRVQSVPFSVNAGDWINWGFNFQASVNGSPQHGIEFLNSAGTHINGYNIGSSTSGTANTSRRLKGNAWQVPANAVNARIYWDMRGPNNYTLDTWEVVVVTSPTQSLVQDTSYYPGTRWQNILGNAGSLTFQRGNELDGVTDKPVPGTLSAVLADPLLDPTKNPRIRPGRAVRVQSYSQAEADLGGTGWVTLWSGNLTTIDVSFNHSVPRVTLQAVDVIALLNNLQVPEGKNGSLGQRVAHVLSGRAPYNLTYSSSADPDVTNKVIDVQENATALDQLVWLSVAKNAYVSATYDNKVQITAAASAGSSPSFTLSDTKADTGAVFYGAIETSFGSQALFNEFLVDRHNLDEEDGAKTYGPYVNTSSRTAWGAKSTTIETNDGVPRDIAERYGKVYANPEIFASSVTYRGSDHPHAVILSEPYYIARLKHGPSGLDKNYRILSVEHEITPEDWLVTLNFRPMEATASVVITNPAGGASAGPGDLVQPDPGPHSRRFRNATFSVANATETGVPYNVVESQDGIPYDDSNRRWTVEKDGRYLVVASVGWAANATGTRVLNINANGTARARSRIVGYTGSNNIQDKAVTLKLVAGDTVSVTATQSSGGALNISNVGAETFGAITFLGA